ncbi:adenylate cyclase type 2-like isoform X2 [Mytilus californianus]|uniref:adenylate cyclase type 2-like isoform X2 n=1 Tax=Mytilus californianus TaxID=6549 RepID=UPI002245DF03|nr:adenylate cyclase type 2-like isoform X2 [Mytilus californianus]
MNPAELCLPKNDKDNRSSKFNQPRNKVSPKVTRSNCLNHNPIPKKYNKAVNARKGQNGHAVETGKTRDIKKQMLNLQDHSVWTLKKKFEVLQIEPIYQNYIIQIQRPLVVGYIGLAVAILLGTVIYHIANVQSFSNQDYRISQSVLIVGQVSLATILVCVIKNSIYLKFSTWISVVIWILLLAISNIYFHIPSRKQTTDDVAVTFFLIFMCHVMLPMSKMLSLCFGGMTIVIQITTSGILSPKENMVAELVSNFVILLSANMMGIGHKYLTDLHHRHTFLEARSMIQVKKKLEWENNQRDELLNCCIPGDMVEEMKGDITEKMLNHTNKNPELYVESHYQDVSILYADIVNFTPLSAKCESPNELIDLLNRLFGRFDQLAEKHQCLRIKILGDCYVCVCGVPKPNPNHALNCVSLGIDMIDAIREVRDESKTDVDMRIGVHSGKVLSGVIGLNKWQYDVWSDDVTLANNMEASGIPGKVHITKNVLVQLGDNHQFMVENGDGQERNEYLREKNIETFILSVKQQEIPKNRPKFSFRSYVKMAMFISKLQWKVEKPFAKWKAVSKAIRMSPGQLAQSSSSKITSEIDIIQMGKKFHAEVNMELENKSRLLGRKSSWEGNKDYNPWWMRFSKELELEYNKEPDLWFKVSLILLFGVFVGIQIVHGVVSVRGFEYYAMFGIGITVFTVLIVISLGENFVSCNRTKDKMPDGCNKPIYFVLCSFLSLSANVLFLQIKYIVKVLLMTVAVIVFDILFHKDSVFQTEGTMSLSVLGSVYTGVMFVALVYFCRQVEFMNRLNFLLKDQCRTEARLSENSASLNMKLLENILPSHVAEYFLTDQAKDQELYSESHENVCIMFASIPNFKEFYQESAARQCIELLNNIIAKFDQMLLLPEFSKVEKIKVIGSTYMAVTGLKPDHSSNPESSHRSNVVTMTKFALKMMSELETITTNTYQFKLRAGINTGPVTAGVIGAKRPLYDIWGDAVNVASRLDSTSEEDNIQVTEKNAEILIDAGFNCHLKGMTLLKGKGEVVTYMVTPS